MFLHRCFRDKSFLLGLGIGIIITTILMSLCVPLQVSKTEIEKRAKEMGMKYPNEIKTYFQNDNK